MDQARLKQILLDLKSGQRDVDQTLDRLRAFPYDDLGYARLDVQREIRQGIPEVVFGVGKTVEQVTAIVERLWQHHDKVLATRVTDEMAAAIQARLPEAHYDATSRLVTLVRGERQDPDPTAPYGLVLSAGTSDQPVAEEAAQTLEFLGGRTERAYDVGVAGLHRLLDQAGRLYGADVIICVAGMEGALTSVVAGLVDCPVIGVPTSVGYGANFGGVAPLLAMLNACAPGVAVVNIDNGFGAGVYAHYILRRITSGCEAKTW